MRISDWSSDVCSSVWGYAPLTLCRHCGYRFQCPNCTAWMVEHRLTRRLACHHCGHVIPTPRACPECHEEDALVACGPGVERIADEVKQLFPQADRKSTRLNSSH